MQICFKYSSTGSSSGEGHQDLRCLSWKVSFNMTVELEKNVPKDEQKKCADYNRDPSTIEDFCTRNENCEYSALIDECSSRSTKKVNITYKVPDPSTVYKNPEILKSLVTRNLKYIVNDNNTEIKLTAENIQCLDWEIKVSNSFRVNKRSNSIAFTGEKCQEFVEIISPKTLDGDRMNTYLWVSFPSVEAPTIENDTLKFQINAPQFKGCEQKVELHITCYIDDITYQLGPFNGTRIDTKSLQDEPFEKCFAVAYMHDSTFKQLYKNKRKPSDFFQPSGQIQINKINLAIIIPSSVGGSIVALVIMGKFFKLHKNYLTKLILI